MSGRGATLEQRFEALEKYVYELPLADTIAPAGGQTIAADGSVAYDFDGHVHADGLDLDSGQTDTPPADRKVRWLRLSDGSVSAEAYGYNDPDAAGFAVIKGHAKTSGESRVRLEAIHDPTSRFAQLSVTNLEGSGGADRDVRLSMTGDNPSLTFSAILLDSIGRSDFLRLVNFQQAAVNFGTTNLFFNGASQSNSATVTHDAGTPRFIGLMPIGAAGNADHQLAFSTWDATASQFTFQGKTVNGVAIGPGNLVIYWVVIGGP